jgi:hypothetical protein
MTSTRLGVETCRSCGHDEQIIENGKAECQCCFVIWKARGFQPPHTDRRLARTYGDELYDRM